MGGQSQRGRQQASVKGKDIVLNVEIDFMDAVSGLQKNVTYNKIDD